MKHELENKTAYQLKVCCYDYVKNYIRDNGKVTFDDIEKHFDGYYNFYELYNILEYLWMIEEIEVESGKKFEETVYFVK